jgi:DNA-binding MarR family transcriptional regulator
MRIREEMIQAEIEAMEKVSGLPIDPVAMGVASNIWRASQLLRQIMERTVLKDYNLTWASFATLYIVWIWGPIEMGEIAKSQSVGASTITSTVGLLEKRGYCARNYIEGNRRSIAVTLTPEGVQLIEEVFPIFNMQERNFTSSLTLDEAQQLARLLRKVIVDQGDGE